MARPGLWFADKDTLYVADEGDGYTAGTDLYTCAAAQTTAGLQKWVFNETAKKWNLAYVISSGLDLGKPYTVDRYPTGTNSATMLPWAPTTDGLRNITGLHGPDGLVAIWGITSTVSGGGDTGADPKRLVVVLDKVKNTTAPVGPCFTFYDEQDAKFAEVLRGVSFTQTRTRITSSTSTFKTLDGPNYPEFALGIAFHARQPKSHRIHRGGFFHRGSLLSHRGQRPF